MILQESHIMSSSGHQPTWSHGYPACDVSTAFFGGSQWHDLHPQYWTKFQVWEWLQHLLDTNQMDASCIPFHEFDINGERLCGMTLQDFTHAAGSAGQILYTSIQSLKWHGQCGSQMLQTLNAAVKTEHSEPLLMPLWKEDNYLYEESYDDMHDSKAFCRAQISMSTASHQPLGKCLQDVRWPPGEYPPREAPEAGGRKRTNGSTGRAGACSSRGGDSDVKKQETPPKTSSKKHNPRGTHLWEFIRDILLTPEKNPGLIKWEDRSEGIFRFLKSEAVAQLWGKKKNNSSMTYEKLSRAMRYYYKREILERVDGRRLVYKFGKNARGWKENDN